MQLILANITLVTTCTCLTSDWTKSGQKLDLFPRKKLGMIKRVSWSHEEWVQKIIRALIDNKYQNKNGGFMRAHNFCHINVKLLDESEMAPVLSSNEHNRPKVYTQHLRCISSLSESGNDRHQKKKQNIETRTEHKIKMLHEGFKKCNAKRKLQQALLTIAAILGPIHVHVLQPKLHAAMWPSREQTMQIIGKSAYPHTLIFSSNAHRSVR